MLIKIHQAYRNIVAICDKELLGRKFEEDIRVLEVKEGFFGGEVVTEKEAIEIMQDMEKEDSTFNIIGEKSIQTALKARIITKQGIKYVQDVPFALVLL